jgi:F-type H+-transporting ATPase subunit b
MTMSMLQDPMFFYSVAFFIFLGLAFHYGREPLMAWIDSEILKIRNELDQAKKLRTEAEAMLADYKSKQTAALAEADAIVKHAKEEAVRLRTQAENDLKESLAKSEQQAAARIRIAESEAMEQVRNTIIDAAMKMAEAKLTAQLDGAAASKLTDQAIGELSKLAGGKAKAA